MLESAEGAAGFMVIVSGAPSDPRHTLPPMVRYARFGTRWKAEAGRDQLDGPQRPEGERLQE